MPRCLLRAVALAATLAAAGAAGAADEPRAIHLEGSQGAGWTRPALEREGCLVEALERRPAAAGFDARVRFLVGRDGRLSAFAFLPPAAAAAEQAVLAALNACPWRPGVDPEGHPVVVQVTLPVRVSRPGNAIFEFSPKAEGPTERPGVPPPPVVMGGGRVRLDAAEGQGYQRPEPVDPSCLGKALAGRRALSGLDNSVKFAVLRDGSLSHFSFRAPVAREVEEAVAAAFQSCQWRPARSPDGEPLAVWVVQPLKVAPMAPEQKARALFE